MKIAVVSCVVVACCVAVAFADWYDDDFGYSSIGGIGGYGSSFGGYGASYMPVPVAPAGTGAGGSGWGLGCKLQVTCIATTTITSTDKASAVLITVIMLLTFSTCSSRKSSLLCKFSEIISFFFLSLLFCYAGKCLCVLHFSSGLGECFWLPVYFFSVRPPIIFV